MASTRDRRFTFKSVQLLRNERLGEGAYGVVFKAKCDQLVCAAKIFHEILGEPVQVSPSKEHRQPIRRFESECDVLSRINHPNIVQYLGTHYDTGTNKYILLMELMDESLTHYLESSAGDIPYHIQVNLASDIAQALAFLHANEIIHRDLSSNNVLLIAGSRAKVADFGMSLLVDSRITRPRSTAPCPGTPAFMPPEVLNEPPVHTVKLDTFSFGVLLVQIDTRQFPNPTPRFNVVQIPDPKNSKGSIAAQIPIPEVERRQAHISLIEPNHPLLSLALRCLKDTGAERPSSQQLCQSLIALKRTAKYRESSQADVSQVVVAKDDQIRSLCRELESTKTGLWTCQQNLKAKTDIIEARNEHLQKTIEDLKQATDEISGFPVETNSKLIDTLQKTIARRDREIERLRYELTGQGGDPNKVPFCRQHQDEIRDLRSEVAELRKLVSEMANLMAFDDEVCPVTTSEEAPAPSDIALSWMALPDTPVPLWSGGSCTTIGDKVYFACYGSTTPFEFDFSTRTWKRLPAHPFNHKGFTIVNINGTLTTVGGVRDMCYANKLFSCTQGFFGKKWIEELPPMRTDRAYPAVMYLSSLDLLVVAGGLGECKLSQVEILSTVSHQWSSVSPLPFPVTKPTVAFCDGFIYLHSDKSDRDEKYSVLKCSVSTLVKSKPTVVEWKKIAPLPVSGSTLATANDNLLAIGGREGHSSHLTNDILCYNSENNSWQRVSGMMISPRSESIVTVLPDNRVMVVGGDSSCGKCELGSLAQRESSVGFVIV